MKRIQKHIRFHLILCDIISLRPKIMLDNPHLRYIGRQCRMSFLKRNNIKFMIIVTNYMPAKKKSNWDEEIPIGAHHAHDYNCYKTFRIPNNGPLFRMHVEFFHAKIYHFLHIHVILWMNERNSRIKRMPENTSRALLTQNLQNDFSLFIFSGST